jgi:hypothetical protein
MDLVFNPARYAIFSQQLNLVEDVIKAMLVTPDFIPDPDMEFVDDGTVIAPINFEVNGTGYEPGVSGSGRVTLTGKLFTIDNNTDRSRFFATDLLWVPINVGPVGGTILIREGDDDTESLLISYTTSGGFPKNTDGGQLEVRWSPNGILAL